MPQVRLCANEHSQGGHSGQQALPGWSRRANYILSTYTSAEGMRGLYLSPEE